MTIKEKPFLDSARNPGPLPAWIFANPFVSGFMSILVCCVFGASLAVVTGFGATNGFPLEVFEGLRGMMAFVVALGAAVHGLILLSIPFARDEAGPRFAFVAGGAACIAVLFGLDAYLGDEIRSRIREMRNRIV